MGWKVLERDLGNQCGSSRLAPFAWLPLSWLWAAGGDIGEGSRKVRNTWSWSLTTGRGWGAVIKHRWEAGTPCVWEPQPQKSISVWSQSCQLTGLVVGQPSPGKWIIFYLWKKSVSHVRPGRDPLELWPCTEWGGHKEEGLGAAGRAVVGRRQVGTLKPILHRKGS